MAVQVGPGQIKTI